ncbi:hypothetical protein ABW20_dc0106067 [Dactylellina cionopaga]|nr:hypothetical protein ABW20_dc0106067 [Dactylellina cionopaga]
MATYQFGPVAMDGSFLYTFFPLLALVAVMLYVKSKEIDRAAKERAAAAPYSLWDPNRKLADNKSVNTSTDSMDFNILSAAPPPFRPYKPIYYMTMGLEKCAPNDLFLIDSSYPSRIALRKELVSQHSNTLGASLQSADAVKELYSCLLSDHLPSRFPNLFIANKERSIFKNNVSGDESPLQPPEPTLSALKILASTVEEDILILQKDPTEDVYRLHAFIACFPSGFDPSEKMGMTLREIHGPVPSFEKTLAPSMDRFFGRLEVGKWVRRFNWTISLTEKLFLPIVSHVYDNQPVPREFEHVDLNKTFLRVERQVLLRLPASRAIVFFIKTYMTPLSEVKEEGQGHDLATAIEGIPEDLAQYKSRSLWGKAVTFALRAEA